MTIAAEQSGLVRAIAIVAVIVVAGIYLYVREQRGKRRREQHRTHRPS